MSIVAALSNHLSTLAKKHHFAPEGCISIHRYPLRRTMEMIIVYEDALFSLQKRHSPIHRLTCKGNWRRTETVMSALNKQHHIDLDSETLFCCSDGACCIVLTSHLISVSLSSALRLSAYLSLLLSGKSLLHLAH